MSATSLSLKKCSAAALLTAGAFFTALTIYDPGGLRALALVAIAALLFSIIQFVFRRKSAENILLALCAVLGLALPLINIYGSGALLTLTLLFFAAALLVVELPIRWIRPWLTVLAVSCAVEIYWNFITSRQDSAVDVMDALRAWHHFPPIWLTALVSMLRWIAFALAFSLFSSRPQFAAVFRRGVLAGLVAATAIIIGDYWGGIHSHLAAQEPFWAALRRYAGSFSDPNALGVAAFLAISLTSHKMTSSARRMTVIIVAAFVIAAVALSGSRSLLLGIMLLALFSLPLSRRAWIAVLVVAALGYGVFASIPSARIEEYLEHAPQSAARAVRSLHPDMAADALNSRVLFARLGLNMWRSHPFFGVGFHRFRERIPEFAKRDGLPIGRWLDNANNFYLGTLAELGLVGLAGLILSLRSIRVRAIANSDDERVLFWQRRIAAVFLILLLVGPHLDFDEVAILFAFIAAQAGVVQKEQRNNRAAFVLLALCLPMMLEIRSGNTYGLFPAEYGDQTFRWSESSSRFLMPCNAVETDLLIRAPNAGENEKSVTVRVSSADESVSVTLTNAEWRPVTLHCKSMNAGSLEFSPLPIRLTTSRYFVPAAQLQSTDFRRLGVQIALQD